MNLKNNKTKAIEKKFKKRLIGKAQRGKTQQSFGGKGKPMGGRGGKSGKSAGGKGMAKKGKPGRKWRR